MSYQSHGKKNKNTSSTKDPIPTFVKVKEGLILINGVKVIMEPSKEIQKGAIAKYHHPPIPHQPALGMINGLVVIGETVIQIESPKTRQLELVHGVVSVTPIPYIRPRTFFWVETRLLSMEVSPLEIKSAIAECEALNPPPVAEEKQEEEEEEKEAASEKPQTVETPKTASDTLYIPDVPF